MRLLFILFLGVCFSDEHLYRVTALNENSELIEYKNVYFIGDSFISMTFQDKSGNSIDLKHESIQNIYDLNDNEIIKINLVERFTGDKVIKVIRYSTAGRWNCYRIFCSKPYNSSTISWNACWSELYNL